MYGIAVYRVSCLPLWQLLLKTNSLPSRNPFLMFGRKHLHIGDLVELEPCGATIMGLRPLRDPSLITYIFAFVTFAFASLSLYDTLDSAIMKRRIRTTLLIGITIATLTSVFTTDVVNFHSAVWLVQPVVASILICAALMHGISNLYRKSERRRCHEWREALKVQKAYSKAVVSEMMIWDNANKGKMQESKGYIGYPG